MQNLWTKEDQILLKKFQEEIVTVPMLEIPYPCQTFNIKKYWTNDIMGEVLLQEDDSLEKRKPKTH